MIDYRASQFRDKVRQDWKATHCMVSKNLTLAEGRTRNLLILLSGMKFADYSTNFTTSRRRLKVRKSILYASLLGLFLSAGTASATTVTLSKLTGVTGGTLAATAVYVADLSSAGGGAIQSITISDNSGGLGGAGGQFSGFDLDAIKLSTTSCADAGCAKTAAGLSVFDFVGGTIFSPGTQRAPTDPQLFGSGPSGNTVENSVATLDLFDGESTVAIPGAFGFLSIGDNGVLSFNLTELTDTTGLFLYIGEVGDNGEVAASTVTINSNRIPEPGSLALIGIALAGLASRRRQQLSQ